MIVLSHCCRPLVCPPKYIVRERCAFRPVPVIQPVINVNRTNVFSVPRPVVRRFVRNEVIDRGFVPGFGAGIGPGLGLGGFGGGLGGFGPGFGFGGGLTGFGNAL